MASTHLLRARRISASALLLLISTTAACGLEVDPELDLAAADAPIGWEASRTLHAGEALFDHVPASSRRVHALWADGSPDTPVPLDILVTGQEAEAVRVAVLAPIRGGARAVVAASGYATPTTEARISVDLTDRGQYLVVVGSFQLAREASYLVSIRCAGAGDLCAQARVDALASPKAGGLVGSVSGGDHLLMTELGAALADIGSDVELEVWRAPPMQSWNAEHLLTSVASGTQINAILPPSVAPGDDLLLVLRDPAGAILDTGVLTRYAPEPQPFARLDAILYGDLASLDIAGVTGFTEGVAELELRSESRDLTIVRTSVRAERPGQTGNGFAAFDAAFTPELTGPDGELNPALPRNGELLSVGWIGGDGSYNRLGCFEYCNNLSGMDTCTGGPRDCETVD